MPSKHHADLHDPEACASTLPDCTTLPSSKKLYDTYVVIVLCAQWRSAHRCSVVDTEQMLIQAMTPISTRKEIYEKLYIQLLAWHKRLYAERIFHNLPSPFVPDTQNKKTVYNNPYVILPIIMGKNQSATQLSLFSLSHILSHKGTFRVSYFQGFKHFYPQFLLLIHPLL